MKYTLEGYDIAGESVSLMTEELEKNIGILKYEVLINNDKEIIDVRIGSNEETDKEKVIAIIKISNEKYNINYEEAVSMREVFIGIFESVINNLPFLRSDKIKKAVSLAISKSLENLKADNIIENIEYLKTSLLINKEGKIVGTAAGFNVCSGTIKLMQVDMLENESNLTLLMENGKGKVIDISLNDRAVIDITIRDFKSEEEKKMILELKNVDQFDNDDDYLIYRRSLLVKEVTAQDFIDENFLDGLF